VNVLSEPESFLVLSQTSMKDDQGVIASLTGIATVSEAGALLDQLANLSSEPSLLVIQAGDALTTYTALQALACALAVCTNLRV